MSSPQKDKVVCAKCSDGAWYRAVVTKVLPDREVEVQYVDYGNAEAVTLSSLRQPARAISHVNSLPFQVLYSCSSFGLSSVVILVSVILKRTVVVDNN